MCGLVGLISPSFPIDINLLNTMRDKLIHRGPTSSGNWIHKNNRIAFGHRRLSIIDMDDSANQPMSTDDGDLTLAFNGEIYNYIELKKELLSLGHTFRTNSDTEVLLLSYKEWGENAISRLNGMFSFLLWDQRSERLLVARDRFGEKPLFVARGSLNTIAFASEIKALLVHPAFDCSVSNEAIEKFTSGLWYEDDELTFFENVERFPVAHAAWFNKEGKELRRWSYWQPDYDAINFDIKPSDAVDQFSELMQRSIDIRLRADVPIGSSLSGGLDSSMIVGCLARRKKSINFSQNTFSAIFPSDPTISEEREIEAVVSHTGVKSFLVSPDPKGLADESAKLHWHQEEPFLSASIYLQWCVARTAKNNNTTVLMDGQGADELLAGYQFYFPQRQIDLLEQGRSKYALRETAKFNRRLDLASNQYKNSYRRFNSSVALSENELREHPSFNNSKTSNSGILRETLKNALNKNSLPMLLRYADRNSMAFSREVRLPFLDHNLVDFCISLPDDYYIRNGWQKWVLRQSAGKLMPQNIRWRADKVGYAAPLDNWLRKELFSWGRERVFDTRLQNIPGYDFELIQKQWKEHIEDGINNSWALWKWISLSEWLENFNKGLWRCG
tara:strand:+ start:7409 stop:9253 length:1845 start_codon:yes stop_codon:yes gene_type:complete